VQDGAVGEDVIDGGRAGHSQSRPNVAAVQAAPCVEPQCGQAVQKVLQGVGGCPCSMHQLRNNPYISSSVSPWSSAPSNGVVLPLPLCRG
jgi:hypothetical protein